MPPRTLVIVNPHSGHGATGRRWRALESRMREALGSVEVERTGGPGDAERLAREAVRAGIERLVVAGGDGTLAEVASGLLRAHLGSYAEIGILPLGTGCDFARTLGIPRDLDAALGVLRTGSARRVDAGYARFAGPQGSERDAYFLNELSFGVSGLVVEITQRTTTRMGAGAAFALGTVRALLRYRSRRVTLRVDGETVLDAPIVLVVAANGRHFGGGMRIAPDARVDDGQLDVVCVAHTSPWKLVGKVPKLYRGTHLSDPIVTLRRGTRIEADAVAGEVAVELDGEARGSLPVRVSVLPAALAVVGPKA